MESSFSFKLNFVQFKIVLVPTRATKGKIGLKGSKTSKSCEYLRHTSPGKKDFALHLIKNSDPSLISFDYPCEIFNPARYIDLTINGPKPLDIKGHY